MHIIIVSTVRSTSFSHLAQNNFTKYIKTPFIVTGGLALWHIYDLFETITRHISINYEMKSSYVNLSECTLF